MDSEQDLPTARVTLAVDPVYNDLTFQEQWRYRLYLAAVLTDHDVDDWRKAERKTALWRASIAQRRS